MTNNDLRNLNRRLRAAERAARGSFAANNAAYYRGKVEACRRSRYGRALAEADTLFGPNLYGPAIESAIKSALFARDRA